MTDIMEMLNIISEYNYIQKKYNFKVTVRGGIKTSSIRWIKDDKKIDIRKSDWTYYDKDDTEIATGNDPKSLDEFLEKLSGDNVG